MTLLAITVQPDPAGTHFDAELQLEGVLYRFSFYTCSETDGWCFDVASDDGSAAVNGLALVDGVDLLAPYRALGLPPGQLFVNVTAGEVDLAAFAEGRARLYYLEAQ